MLKKHWGWLFGVLDRNEKYTAVDNAEGNGSRNLESPRWRTICFALLAMNIITTILALGIAVTPSIELRGRIRKGMFPDLPVRMVTFDEDAAFANTVPGEKNSAWDSFLPEGKGFIEVTNPSSWGLSGGFPVVNGSSPASEQYCISMFHQLHCVAALKRVFAKLVTSGRDLDDDLKMAIDSGHVNHCFDYLRQAIMCAGDMTLEKAKIIQGQAQNEVDGWGVAHECYDWRSIYDFASKHRVGTAQGILNPGG